MSDERCPRCGGPGTWDRAHLSAVLRADVFGQVPLLFRCRQGHETWWRPPARRGRYVPICDVCEQPVIPADDGKQRRYHPGACIQRAYLVRSRPMRYVWVPDG